jgi:CRISPR-associated protein (TIGR03984 family)
VTSFHGAILDALPDARCRQLIGWAVDGQGSFEAGSDAHIWLLAYCDDGVVWGHRHNSRRPWSLSGEAFPDVSPRLDPVTLQELRLFGPAEELLVWRTQDGFAGRRIADGDQPGPNDSRRPVDEARVVLGDRLDRDPAAGFSVVADATGSRHAVPLVCRPADFTGRRWPLRLHLRHYLTQDPETGAVRVAASRLLDLTLERP